MIKEEKARKSVKQKIKWGKLYKDKPKVPYVTRYNITIPLNEFGLFKEGDMGVVKLSDQVAYTLKWLEDDRCLIEDVYKNQTTDLVGRKKNSTKSKQAKISQEDRQILSMQPDKKSLKKKAKELGISNRTAMYWWSKDFRETAKENYRDEGYPNRKNNDTDGYFSSRTIRHGLRDLNKILSGEIEIGKSYEETFTDPTYSKGVKNGQESK